MDLRLYIPTDHRAWIPVYADKLGWDYLTRYYNKVFLLLINMQPGTEFRVIDRVSPDNYDLFIKCAVTAYNEIMHSDLSRSYFFEQDATVILAR